MAAVTGAARPGATFVGILGPLELRIGDRSLDLTSKLERTLLAALAVRAGRPVGIETLADDMWPARLPATWRKNIHVRVSRVRAVLAESAGADLLRSSNDGYWLQVEPDDVDATRFERLQTTGRQLAASGLHEEATAALQDALGLWRGDPLPELADSDTGRCEIARLTELREAAVDDLQEAGMALGGHVALVAEIEASLVDQPLREQRWERLMLALYRSGRQGEALRAYQRARAVLGNEMGLEPSPSLRGMEAAIIEHSPLLDLPGADRRPSAIASTPTSGDFPPGTEARLAWARRQAEVPLVGRNHELGLLHDAWRRICAQSRGGLVLLSGPAGVGKTRLTAEVALAVAESDDALVVPVRCVAGRGLTLLSDAPLAPATSPRPSESVESGAALEHILGLHHQLTLEPTRRPMLLVLDDMHEIDPLTVSLLFGFMDRPMPWGGPWPLLMIAAFRDDVALPTGTSDLLVELPRLPLYERQVVGPLDRAAAKALLLERLGADPGLDQLVEESGGVPGYLIAIADHLRDVGACGADDQWVLDADPTLAAVGLPDTLRLSVGERIDRLPRELARFLTAISRLDEPIDIETAAGTMGGEREVALDLLDQAVATRMLVETPGCVGAYGFATTVDRLALATPPSSVDRGRGARTGST